MDKCECIHLEVKPDGKIICQDVEDLVIGGKCGPIDTSCSPEDQADFTRLGSKEWPDHIDSRFLTDRFITHPGLKSQCKSICPQVFGDAHLNRELPIR